MFCFHKQFFNRPSHVSLEGPRDAKVGGVKGVKSFRVVRLNADDSDDSGRVARERGRAMLSSLECKKS